MSLEFSGFDDKYMKQELSDLKSEMLTLDIAPQFYGIDEQPYDEGFCIYDARSVIEVFYYERGQKMRLKTFTEVKKAVSYFREQIALISDKI